jgi:23S rRNA (adenine2503-C2)-methyltransferase
MMFLMRLTAAGNLVQFDLAEPAQQLGVGPSRALFGMSLDELNTIALDLGEPAYRGQQIFDALYRQRADSLDAITTLPLSFRAALEAAGYSIAAPRIAQSFQSKDGTERYLVELADGRTVETVWMPEGDGTEEWGEDEEQSASKPYRRATICVSSQVGCAVRCQFCFTARMGLERHLTAGEIAGQVTAVLNRHDVEIGSARGQGNPDRINLVFMGMGEPFHNYDNFMDAFRLLVDGVGIPASRMTVSTSGIVPGIEAFAREPLRPRLAISLNAPNDDIRERIMPITRKWPIAELVKALKAVSLSPRERLTFEYVLLAKVNDQMQHAEELVSLIKGSGLRAKVNLIVWNPGPELDFAMPSPDTVAAFQAALRAAEIPAYIRRPRGLDIFAACGQLKRTVESSD